MNDVIVKIVQVFVISVWCFFSSAAVTDEEYALMPELFHLDDFDTCTRAGKRLLYCSIVVELSSNQTNNHSTTWKVIQEVVADRRNYRHDILRHGICVRKSCPNIIANNEDTEKLQNDISDCYTSKYATSGLKAKVTEMHCESDQNYHPIDEYDKTVAIALAVLIWIVTFSTFYEGMARYKPIKEYEDIIENNKLGRLIACFSLRRNWSRLQSDNSNPDTDPLKGLQGIRFYNTQLVIMAHEAMLTLAGPVVNTKFPENLTRKTENVLFINGYCTVQTFMLVTGFLIAYNFLLFMEKHKKFQLKYIILAFVNRYIRLTPCLIVMMAFNATWLYHLGTGPMWNKFLGTEYRNCRRNWWANLLYINNYYDSANMCMQHTWYLATDTQLFVVALFIVALMWKYQNRMKLILVISVIIGIAAPFLVNYYNDYDIVIRTYPEAFYSLFLDIQQWHVMYSWAPTNFGAYAIGLTFGYICYKNRGRKFLTKKIYVAVWWALIWGLPLGVICYGIFIYRDDYLYDRLGAAIYATVQRNLFSLGICLFIFGVVEGVGWFLLSCVTWSPLQVLGRLTYCTYLVHVVIIRLRGGQSRVPTYISYYTLLNHTLADAVLSYICGTILALFVELPVSALQKLMVPQKEEIVTANEKNNNSFTAINSEAQTCTTNVRK